MTFFLEAKRNLLSGSMKSDTELMTAQDSCADMLLPF